MNPGPLAKIAYTVECFLNATRLPDGHKRAQHEEWLVQWLYENDSGRNHAVYQRGNLFCYDKAGKVVKNFALHEAGNMPHDAPSRDKTIWCDGRKISLIDGAAFVNGKLVMLGAAGLILTMPGLVGAHPDDPTKAQVEISTSYSNNNNNNNNNNNG